MTIAALNLEAKIARCRLIISLIAIVAVYIDPTEPSMTWLGLHHGGYSPFAIDPLALTVMTLHLAYSLAVYDAVARRGVPAARIATLTMWLDVAFGIGIVVSTEGTSSPFWGFFVFAVIAAGFHGGFRRAMVVTTLSVGAYLSFIVIAWHGQTNFYIMRPVYLAVVGYLTAYLGEQRLILEGQVHQLEAVKERARIARALHDGSVQTLAGVNLTLESCRRLIRSGRLEEALAGLGELQASLNREHDELRSYARELAEVERTPPPQQNGNGAGQTRFVVSADFAGSAAFVDQVLQILREAITNVKRHAGASSAVMTVRAADAQVHIDIDDDGVGFANPEQIPWSMSSRVSDIGGVIRVARDTRPGAHLRLALPEG